MQARSAPSTPAFLAIGALMFPIDVGSVIGPNCKWSVEPLVFVPVQTNASGMVAISTPWTISTVDSLVLHVQGLHYGPSGLASTNAVHSSLGGAGLSMYVYNYTRDGPVAQFGPYASNRGPILLVPASLTAAREQAGMVSRSRPVSRVTATACPAPSPAIP